MMSKWRRLPPGLAIAWTGIACMGMLTGCAAVANKAERDKTHEEWQALARTDLKAVHDAIVVAHPGYIDAANPSVRAWTEQGYREAQALIPRVVNYDTMLSAIGYYTAGFRDGHLMYSDNIRSKNYLERINGWRVDKQAGVPVVTAVFPGWGKPLPPLGSVLLDCDGRTPDAIVEADVAPYVERRNSPALRDPLLWYLRSPLLAGLELKRCTFRHPDGQISTLDMHYRDLPTMEATQGLRTTSSPSNDRRNRYDLRDGVLWIHTANFMLGTDEGNEFRAMLTKLTPLQGMRRIVFDTRGNSGGDSAVGQQIIDAATGGLAFDTDGLDLLPQTYAQWRVSEAAVAGVSAYIGWMTERDGTNASSVDEMKRLHSRLRAAQREGEPWIDDIGEPRLTRSEIAKRNGGLRKFNGTVAVITDGSCVSACLDFVDRVRLIPGSVQLGRTTGSDTVYLERTSVILPSGNALFLPMKVWRNRVRGDGEALVPDVALDVDMQDTAAVRAATLTALDELETGTRKPGRVSSE